MDSYLSNKFRILSFISMVMVVYLHAYIPMDSKSAVSFVQYYFSREITRTAVPLFFLISGILFFRNINCFDRLLFWSKIRRRIQSLLIPYLIFSELGFIFIYVAQQFVTIQSYEQIANLTLSKYLYILFLQPIGCYQLWFIRDLFILSFLSPCIYYGLKKMKIWLIFCLFLLWILGIQYIVTIESIFFFTVGAYLGCYQQHFLEYKIRSRWNILCLIIWCIIALFNAYNRGLYCFHCLGILIGICSIWLLYDLFYNKFRGYILSWLFSYSFFIYLTHEPLLAIVKNVLLVILGKSSASVFITYIIAPIITIIFCIIVGHFLKKKCNKGYLIITGGR